MVQIRKKTGLVQSFDPNKIISAVQKSADRVNVEMTPTKNNKIIELVLDQIKDVEVVDVKDLHNFVEIALDDVDIRVAKSYREYRNYKLQFIKMMDEVYRKKFELNNVQDASNANADSELITTQCAIVYNNLNSELYSKFFLTDEERKAVDDGYIYIHDKGARYDKHNCFERSTRFITSNGVKSFYDFNDGDFVKVLSHKGIWRKARVIRLPWSKIHRVWFKRASGKETFVDCTLNHRWLLKDGSITQDIKVGDILVSTPDITNLDFDSLSLYYKKLWCLGFGFADGTVSRKEIFTEREKLNHIMRIRLCGKKTRFLNNFIKSGYSYGKIKDSEDIMVYMNDIHSKILPYNMDEISIKVFMDGYLNADGDRNLYFESNSEYRGLTCVGKNNEWMSDFLNISGHYITRINDLSGQETNYGVRKENTLSYSFYSSSGNRNWKVTKIEQINLNSKANVWCLDVEEDHSFLLEKGIPTGNCMLFDMKEVLTGGFKMGNINYAEPKHVGTAMSVMAEVMFNAGASQYGGFTVSEVDKLFAPYAEYSYGEYYKEYLSITGSDDLHKADEYAFNKVRKDIEDGAVEIECRMNSSVSARGDFIFTSISFGLATDRFGTLVSSCFLKVRKEGQGKKGFKIPVLFPKLTFLYDENIHGKGKECEWLFLEAVDCTMKAQYPDFLSMSGDGYAPSIYKKYGIPISRMGCVCGKHNITYRSIYDNVEHTVSFSEFWESMSNTHIVEYHSEDGVSSDYMLLNDIEILDLTQFVSCTKLIRNPNVHDWCKVTFSSGDVIDCTSDHLWTTKRGTFKTLHLNIGDVVQGLYNGDVIHYTVKNVEFIGDHSGENYKWSFDVTTDTSHFNCDKIRSHNCRANLSAWYEYGGMDPAEDLYEVEYEDGKKEIVHKYSLSELDHSCIKCTKRVDDLPRYNGRLNLGAISLNFPMIVAKSKEENKEFFDLLTYYLDLSRKIHLRTIEYFSHKKAGINPLAFCEGGAYKGHKKPDEELGREFLRPFTVSFGITALNEATVMYNGKTIYEDKSEFASQVLQYINDYANRRKKEDGVLYAIYGTPAESLCGLQVKQFRKKYGIVKGVSDREYFSNSFHMHVSEDITPIEKQDAEYKCFHLSNGGNIMYNRFTSDSNKEAYVTLIRRAMRMGYYYGCNQSKDYCTKCGSEFMDMDSCPNCGSNDIVRIERVCGYLGFSRVGDKTRMNDCKLEEIKDRKSM